MRYNKLLLSSADFPSKLVDIPTPPKQLYMIGCIPPGPAVAIIGSRKHTAYGKAVTQTIAESLARKGVVIISGLALGIDSVAHQACLDVGGKTVAVLPRGLDAIYPSRHAGLANNIVTTGGGLVSEYASGTQAYPANFVARNRLVSGLAAALAVTEANIRSGTMHTVRFALEQGREVFAVPGPITSPASSGTNYLLQQGAHVLTDPQQLLDYFGQQLQLELGDEPVVALADEAQIAIYALLKDGSIIDGPTLHHRSQLSPAQFAQAMTMLEIEGHIKALGGDRWVKA